MLLLLPASLMAAGPDMEKLVFYLPCDNAANPVDASADPADGAPWVAHRFRDGLDKGPELWQANRLRSLIFETGWDVP
jgi:hypothetical protein